MPSFSAPRRLETHELHLHLQRPKALEKVFGKHPAIPFMRLALYEAHTTPHTEAFIVETVDGVLAAAGCISYKDSLDEWHYEKPCAQELVGAALIEYLGSVLPGAGSLATQALRERAKERNRRLYLDPTATALPYWLAHGVVLDPYGVGSTKYYGWPENPA